MCSDQERDREKEKWIDKGKQGRKHDEKWGEEKTEIKEVSLSDRELSE